ncbi:DUF6383 domain-containing protein [uncultured Bacteroides sp.]|uniref:leucine-rich repeat domain-containing protein n=1 Tax=uncultured Bacteroides sp. TaxID=162156 RepID=UPI002AABF13A|nr:DUF6383 domain-containing protein [uncultured Bacteroides sp.]
MKKKLLSLLLLLCVTFMANAQEEPTITLTASTGSATPLTLSFAASEASVKLMVDWGDGTKVETPEIAIPDGYGASTAVTGTPVGQGVIKIYGSKIVLFDCSFTSGAPKVSALDITKAVDLQTLDVTSNSLVSLNTENNTNLTKLVCMNNLLTALDLTKNTALTSLDCTNNKLTVLNLSQNTLLKTLKCGTNQLSTLDLTNNTVLTDLYALTNLLTSINLSKNVNLGYVSLNTNLLESLDVTNCNKITRLFCLSNKLTELKTGTIATGLNCSKNKLTFSTLPTISTLGTGYTYYPQDSLSIAKSIKVGDELDLSAQNNINGILTAPQATTYTWQTKTGTALVAGTDYTENNGKFTFLKATSEEIYAKMASTAFPKFTGTNSFMTTTIKVLSSPVGMTYSSADLVQVFNQSGDLYISNLKGGENIKVYNAQGAKIAETINNNATANFTVKSGIYIVTVNGKAYKVAIQ